MYRLVVGGVVMMKEEEEEEGGWHTFRAKRSFLLMRRLVRARVMS